MESNTNIQQQKNGSLIIEHVSNGYLITTGNGSKFVAGNDTGALGAISQMFKGALPVAPGTVTQISITIDRQ